MFAFSTLVSLFLLNCFAEPPAGKNWKLVWEDGFNYNNADLDKDWIAQNGDSTHIACSRWRENVDVKDGKLILTNKKESKGGKDWTSGSIWTKKLFKYGYFECRYKYANHHTTNNSFWLMTQWWQKKSITKGKAFEIDINEGWTPDIIRTNIHNWSDFWTDENGEKEHKEYQQKFCLSKKSGSPDKSIELPKPITATKLRFSSKNLAHFHLRSIRAWEPNDDYPSILTPTLSSAYRSLTDHVQGAKISATSPINEAYPKNPPENAVDKSIATAWITNSIGPKFIEIDFGEPKQIGCIQFLTGWLSKTKKEYDDYIYNYKLEYYDGKNWITIKDVESDRVVDIDLSKDFHVYALEWNEDELVYYFDGKELRRSKNEFCHWESPVWLSLAILRGLGDRDDSLNNTHMDVDYVKVWQIEGSNATMRDRAEEDNYKR